MVESVLDLVVMMRGRPSQLDHRAPLSGFISHPCPQNYGILSAVSRKSHLLYFDLVMHRVKQGEEEEENYFGDAIDTIFF